jgi:hypothetical protein
MSVTIKTKSGETKQYSTVAERLTALHEAGKELEVLESAPVQIGDHYIWRVLLLVNGNTYVGNAEVHLNSSNFAEKADPWATAETSAVGRALAWCGYAGTPDSPVIASADEILRNEPAQSNGSGNAQLDAAPPSASQLQALRDLAIRLERKIHKPATWQEAELLISSMRKEVPSIAS